MGKTIKLCRNCVHFVPEMNRNFSEQDRIAFGKCLRFATTDLLTGATKAPYASSSRPYVCRGREFESVGTSK